MQHPLDISKKVYANLEHVIEFASCRASNTFQRCHKTKYKKKSTMISSGHFSECETAVACWNYRNSNSLVLTFRMARESPISAQMLRVWVGKKGQKQRKCWRSSDKERRYSWKMTSKGGPMNSGERRSKTNGQNARVLKRSWPHWVLALLGLAEPNLATLNHNPLLQTSIAVMLPTIPSNLAIEECGCYHSGS